MYTRDGSHHRALAIQVLAVRGGLIADIHGFVDPDLFGWFGLPLTRRF